MTLASNEQTAKWAATTQRHLDAAKAPAYVKVNHYRHTASIVECDLFTHDKGTEVRYLIHDIELGSGGVRATSRIYNDFNAAKQQADEWQAAIK